MLYAAYAQGLGAMWRTGTYAHDKIVWRGLGLGEHEERITALQERKAELENRVELLDPENVDPDYASELVRGNLGVAHPDEYVVELEPID